jgi:hypothetical protein
MGWLRIRQKAKEDGCRSAKEDENGGGDDGGNRGGKIHCDEIK